jgi:hypothetical protein
VTSSGSGKWPCQPRSSLRSASAAIWWVSSAGEAGVSGSSWIASARVAAFSAPWNPNTWTCMATSPVDASPPSWTTTTRHTPIPGGQVVSARVNGRSTPRWWTRLPDRAVGAIPVPLAGLQGEGAEACSEPRRRERNGVQPATAGLDLVVLAVDREVVVRGTAGGRGDGGARLGAGISHRRCSSGAAVSNEPSPPWSRPAIRGCSRRGDHW